MIDANAKQLLKSYVSRIENLEAEKKTIADDIKDVYGEVKSSGLDPKIVRKIISLRKQDERERTEEEMIMDAYLQALDMRQADLFQEAAE